jgi:hypothetical protein
MPDLNESETRKKLINPMLVAAGWDIVSYDETKGLKNSLDELKERISQYIDQINDEPVLFT